MANNAYIIKPELSAPFPNVPDFWRCPITGLFVPKNPAKNLQWRAELLAKAEEDEELQKDLYTACSQSVLFWVNAFAFTFVVQETDGQGRRRQAQNSHKPYVTWDIQDKHILELEKSIDGGHDMLTDKTRDMGSTWDHIAVFHHQWLFREGRMFLEMSRVETDVDGANNPRCLFVKHDYINKWLPEWMLPSIDRTRMHIVNLDNGSRIDGESSNKAAGSGDRRHAILLDEFAKMENAEKIKSATADVAPCRLPNSTPWGPGTTYSKWRMSGQIKVFTLPWYEHPEKGANRYIVQEEVTGKWKIRSPWYDLECQKRTPLEMAQEIDMDHIGSGDTFFEGHIAEEHRRMFGRKEVCSRTIDFKKSIMMDAIPGMCLRAERSGLQISNSGPLRIWVHLIGGRLDQTKTYILGIDISKGQGASNSVISIFCKETGEKVAEWADANTPPYDFARIACAVAIWVGGVSHGGKPLLIWEANGPGWDFGREIVKKFQYPIFYVDRATGTTDEKQGNRYGWHSSADKKEVMLGHYRRALAQGGFINPSQEAMDEVMTYIRHPDGYVGPAALMEESPSARKTHGDRVIADALALWGCGDTPKLKHKDPAAPHKSIGGRMTEWKNAKKRTAQKKYFDFRGMSHAD
jgi:hypothetical protein